MKSKWLMLTTLFSLLISVVSLQVRVTYGQETQQRTNQQQVRQQRLADLEKEASKTIRKIEGNLKKLEAKKKSLAKKIRRIRSNTRSSSKSLFALQKFGTESVTVQEELAKKIKLLEVSQDKFEQQRRGILAEFPLAGELPFIRYNDQWLTKSEYDYIKHKGEKAQQRETYQKNGKILADWVWQELGRNYSCRATLASVVAIDAHNQRVVPSSGMEPVYTLNGNKISTALPGGNNANDAFLYQVDYTNQLGQAMQGRGRVEIGYDADGNPYLLGAVVPFLNNPLNGRLAPTRSKMDRALQKAFGH